MTLSFSTQWPKQMGEWAGQPNYFIDKIWSSLHKQSTGLDSVVSFADYTSQYARKFPDLFHWDFFDDKNVPPKLHTIRHDPHGRWKPGMLIHPVINNRSKNQFQFAPTIKCMSTQEVIITEKIMTPHDCIKLKDGRVFTIQVDGKYLPMYRITELAINDGFDSVEQFFAWFNGDFKGKIIHWTVLRY